jgi:hypothetical protein
MKMNKLTKVGLSALCGSLAAVSSANAGEMTVTGGADLTWMSLTDASTGNPVGMGSNLTFKGAGELDNGWAFAVTVAMLNKDAYSSTAVNLDMGGLGSLNFNQGDSGNGIDAYDDVMPTAWEETWGNGLGTGVQLVSGSGPQSNVQYKTPTLFGTTMTFTVAPDMGSADVNDKGSGNNEDNSGAGYDVTINVNPGMGTEILSGLNIFAGAHEGQKNVEAAATDDRYEATGGFTYSLGPISIGYQASGIYTGKNDIKTDVSHYKNQFYGVAFNVNDDLSVSYGQHDSQQGFVSTEGGESVHMSITSMQIAYTMGGASIRYAESEVDNASYQSAAMYDQEARVISVALAF